MLGCVVCALYLSSFLLPNQTGHWQTHRWTPTLAPAVAMPCPPAPCTFLPQAARRRPWHGASFCSSQHMPHSPLDADLGTCGGIAVLGRVFCAFLVSNQTSQNSPRDADLGTCSGYAAPICAALPLRLPPTLAWAPELWCAPASSPSPLFSPPPPYTFRYPVSHPYL